MAAYLATGTTEASGADIVLTDGATAMLNLTAASPQQRIPPGARATVEVKTSDAVYIYVGELTGNEPCKILSGPGTYRVTRKATAVSVGVDKS